MASSLTTFPGPEVTELTNPTPAAPKRDLLCFTLGDSAFAFPLSRVRELLAVKPITPVPRAPFGVLGILSVRGNITTVMDLRRLLWMPESPLTRDSRVLLVEEADEVIGVLVDEVLQVYRLEESQIEDNPTTLGDLAPHIIGIGRPDEEARPGGPDIIVLLEPTLLLRSHR